jgi:hypothetical protein
MLGQQSMSSTPKTKQWIAGGFSVFIGAFVWVASPYFTGQREPWDTSGFYYSGTLAVGGLLAGLFAPRRFWLWGLSIWLGQIIGFIWCIVASHEIGPLAPLGFLLLAVTSMWGLAGSSVGAIVGKLCRKFIPRAFQPK